MEVRDAIPVPANTPATLGEPSPCNPATETALQPLIICVLKAYLPNGDIFRRSVFSQTPAYSNYLPNHILCAPPIPIIFHGRLVSWSLVLIAIINNSY